MTCASRALIVCALAACTIKDIDYTGKDCPCPDGYACNTPTQTCVKTLAPDGGGGGVDGSQTDGNTVTDSCLTNPLTKLTFSSVGFPEFPNGWLSGLGSWTLAQGEVQQSNAANEIAWLARTGTMPNGQSNYRVVVAAHVIDGLDAEVGAVFRATSSGTLYACTLDPRSSELRLHRVTSGFQDAVLMMRALSPAFGDTRGTFKIEAMSVGASLQCCVRGYAGMTVSAQDATIPSGSPGLAAFSAEAGFSEFYVYE